MFGLLGLNKWLLGGSAAIVLGLGVWVGVTKYQLSTARVTIEKQNKEILVLKINDASNKKMLELKEAEINAANTRHLQELKEADNVCKQLIEIERAPESDNGEPAAIIKRTIDALPEG